MRPEAKRRRFGEEGQGRKVLHMGREEADGVGAWRKLHPRGLLLTLTPGQKGVPSGILCQWFLELPFRGQ